MSTIAVTKVVPGDNYELSVFFDNGESGTLDMKQWGRLG